MHMFEPTHHHIVTVSDSQNISFCKCSRCSSKILPHKYVRALAVLAQIISKGIPTML
jgi:hypothetical protein